MTTATGRFSALGSWTSYLTTGLNSLADGARVTGAAIDNNTTRATHIQWHLALAATFNPASGAWIDLYRLLGTAAAGSFDEGSDSIQPQPGLIAHTWVPRVASAARSFLTPPLLLPAFSKWIVQNQCGSAWASSGNTLSYHLFTRTSET